ncbi:MAG TPA: serine protease [Clostridiales bacterium]|nr:serine protease [Clostridiales bacterium]
MVSPVSAIMALSMLANGADGRTLEQMEGMLGMPVGQLNEYLYNYAKNLPNGEGYKLDMANSVWLIPGIEAGKDFLQNNDRYYGAEVFRRIFNCQTVDEINQWVKDKTDGMINKMIDVLDPSTVMCLINAIAFDAKWKEIYYKEDVSTGEFNAPSGKKMAEFMYSKEKLYLDDGLATGFIKPYENGYSFVALLPNEGVSLDEYVKGLTGERFLKIIENSQQEPVYTYLPKFNFSCTVVLNGVLQSLGMKDAFSSKDADFSKIGKLDNGNIYVDTVLHKTRIIVNEGGTSAAAATIITGLGSSWVKKTVRLDRPFVFAIIENESKLPVFIGTVMEP